MNNSRMPVLVPIGFLSQNLDNDAPGYVFGGPDLYLTLALAYDSMAAPSVKIDGKGISEANYTSMQPRLALKWEEQANGDWIVDLRPGVLSHAGHEFTSADAAWALEKAYAHETLSSWRWREIVGVEGTQILEKHKIRYCLRSPYPAFPNWLLSVTPNIVDSTTMKQHATASDPWAIDWLTSNVAGYGAYSLDHMDSEHLLFNRRIDYWRGAPESPSIEVRRWPDRQSAINLLDESRPVVVVGTDPDETLPLLGREDLTLRRTWAGHVSVEIDFTKPPFDDQRVRHALAFATPSDELISSGLLGMARRWHSPVKSVSQCYDASHWHYDYNLETAKSLLKEAGLGDGFKSDFYYFANRRDCTRMAEIIGRSWAKIGIELNFKDISDSPPGWLPPLLLRTECSHNLSEPIYDIAHDYAAMSPVIPAPGGPPNVGTWTPRWVKNKAAIKDYVDILTEKNRAIKMEKFGALQKYLVDFSSSIFIAEVQHTMIANKHVPDSMTAPDSRLFHTMQYQNTTSNYLPARPKRGG